MKNKFISKKMIKGIVTAGLLALMCILTSSGKGVEAQEITADVWQDITVSASKTFILSENDNSMWIPVNVSKKGVVNLECTLTENETSVFVGMFDRKDMTSEREFTHINKVSFIHQETGKGHISYSVRASGVRYIYIEKDVKDRGKKITVDITSTFYEQFTPEMIEKNKSYSLVQTETTDYRFVILKPQKVTFTLENGWADILDYKKNICSEVESSGSFYLDAGTYYLRVYGSDMTLLSFSAKDAAVKDATNVKMDMAKKIELPKSKYLKYKKNKNRELWYKIKADKTGNYAIACSYDSQAAYNYVSSLTVYDSKGKKIEKTDGNIVTLKKGNNYVRVKLNKDAVSGIIKTTLSYSGYKDEKRIDEFVAIQNSASLYAKDIIGSTYTVKNYSNYKKLLKKVEKKFEAKNKGFNIECDEFYAALTQYDKSFFKENNLYLFAYDVSESGKITYWADYKINKDEGSLVLTADRYDLASGVNKAAASYFLVSVKKSEVKGISKIIAAEQIESWMTEKESDKQRAKWVTPLYIPDENTDNTINCTGIMLDFEAKWFGSKNVISTYSQYKKLILNSTEEIPGCLKGFKKSYFKKNNLIFYTYTATDSGKNARGAYITKENINGVNTLVCSFVGLPYYGGGFDSVEHYCYVVQISKKDTAKAEKYRSRHVAMRCR